MGRAIEYLDTICGAELHAAKRYNLGDGEVKCCWRFIIRVKPADTLGGEVAQLCRRQARDIEDRVRKHELGARNERRDESKRLELRDAERQITGRRIDGVDAIG